MRVLLVTPYYKPAHLGGIERAIERLAWALRAEPGIERRAVLTTHYAFPPRYVEGLAAHEVQRGGLEVFRLTCAPHRPAPLFPRYSCPATYFSPREIGHILHTYKPDVLHFVGDGWIWAHLALLARRSRHTATVFTPSFHDLDGWRAPLRWPNILICRQVERVVVLSKLEWRGVAEAYRPQHSKLVRIPWGATVPAQPAVGSVPGAPLTILCVGRLGTHKGQLWLLDLYLQAREHFSRPVRLVMVGADEGDAGGRAALQRQIAEAGLDNEVVLTGEVDDDTLARWYSAADLFVLFSHYEAFGLVYVEAMAYGMPVLTHAVGATTEILRSGATVVPPYDRDAALAALVRMVEDQRFRTSLGAEARRLVQNTYAWDVVARTYGHVYEEAIDERRRASRTAA
jgi:glycosyltransferase involved in cell wall biosynthesis